MRNATKFRFFDVWFILSVVSLFFCFRSAWFLSLTYQYAAFVHQSVKCFRAFCVGVWCVAKSCANRNSATALSWSTLAGIWLFIYHPVRSLAHTHTQKSETVRHTRLNPIQMFTDFTFLHACAFFPENGTVSGFLCVCVCSWLLKRRWPNIETTMVKDTRPKKITENLEQSFNGKKMEMGWMQWNKTSNTC